MPVLTTAFQKTAFQNNAFQIAGAVFVAAQYRLLLPHWINDIYYEGNTIITEGKEVPVGWVPSLAVDPLNTTAVSEFYTAGPRDLSYEDLNQWGFEQYTQNIRRPPITHWVRSGTLYSLTGLGSNLPPIGSV